MLDESAALAGETGSAEETAEEFSLNLVAYVRRAAGAWRRTVAAFAQVIAESRYDLVIGDETYEIAGALARRPALKRAPFVMIYDFVGIDAMTRNPVEHLMAYLWNRAWCGGQSGRPPAADLVLFIGEPEDVPDRPFGFGLPNRREYACRYYQFVGYVLGFDPGAYADRASVRRALGYDERPLVVCAVGGTAVGADLLRLCAEAYPHLVAGVPDVQMVLVCGPRLDPATVPAPNGVQVYGYVPRLFEHLAACDAAVVQSGGTTTLELTALRRPVSLRAAAGALRAAANSCAAADPAQRRPPARFRRPGPRRWPTPLPACSTAADLAADPHRRRPPGRRADQAARNWYNADIAAKDGGWERQERDGQQLGGVR